jgi:hypothetical protein
MLPKSANTQATEASQWPIDQQLPQHSAEPDKKKSEIKCGGKLRPVDSGFFFPIYVHSHGKNLSEKFGEVSPSKSNQASSIAWGHTECLYKMLVSSLDRTPLHRTFAVISQISFCLIILSIIEQLRVVGCHHGRQSRPCRRIQNVVRTGARYLGYRR